MPEIWGTFFQGRNIFPQIWGRKMRFQNGLPRILGMFLLGMHFSFHKADTHCSIWNVSDWSLDPLQICFIRSGKK
jgi:hypothetical protein